MNTETRTKKERFIAAILIGIALISVMVTPAMAADFWQSDSDITSGLGVDWHYSSPTVFNKDGTWYLISGDNSGVFYGFKWNGSAWQSDPAIVSGLEDYGYPNGIERESTPEVFYKDGTWYLISGINYNEYPYPYGFIGFYWNSKRSKWLPDSDIVAGLPERVVGTSLGEPTVFNKDGTWYLISGEGGGIFHGYNWTGSAWQSDTAIILGLSDIGDNSAPAVFYKDGTWYLISGDFWGGFYGYNWTGSAWESDPAIVSGLGSIGELLSRPTVFNMDETWYLISGGYSGTFYGWHQVKTPDLTTTAINTPELFVNQPSTITATIANIGDADAGSFNASLSANGVVVDTTNIPSLSAGDTTNVSFEWTPELGGDIELCVVADSANAIDEINEANNDKCTLVTVNAPDLTPTAITAPPLFVNLTSSITAAIDNVGTADAGSFNVSLSADEAVVDTVSVPSLSAGNTTNVSFKWTPASAGNHQLCVVADTDDAIPELDETNNNMCIAVTVSEHEVAWYYGASIPWSAKRLFDGNTLIAEFGNHRVIEVTPTGDMEWHYGTEGLAGSGPGELDCPVDAERLASGNTLITDSKNHRVIEVDTGGNIVWQYGNGTPGAGINQLSYPMDAERLASGNTLITDEHNCRIIEVITSDYDTAKENSGFSAESIEWQYGTTGVSGSGANELNFPKEADRLANGNTLIADYRNHRVVEVNASGGIVWQYGTGSPDEPGSGLNELNNPTDAERLPNGNTLITDFSNNRVIEVRTSSYDPHCLGFEPYAIVWQYDCTRPADAERLASSGNTLIAVSGDNCVIEAVTHAIPGEELKPAAPFFISGFVNYMDGTPVTNSTVILTNENTSEVYIANTSADSNYYQALTCAYSAGAGSVLHFDVDDNKGSKTIFDHTVTANEINAGGFGQNVTIEYPYKDLIVTRIDAYHNKSYYPKELYPPYFNLSNEVNVTVTNTGNTPANSSHVSLYIDGEYKGKKEVPGIDAGASATVQFKWMPEGKDCEDGGTSVTYTLKAIADCDNEIEEPESEEANNELTAAETAYWAGYSADEELVEASHGVIRGGLLYTTGDGSYVGLYSHGSYKDTHYNIELPADATVKHARLNVYYTWSRTKVYPVMEVNITNATGTYTVPIAASYNDRPCDTPAISFEYPWGNYVYDLTPYIQGSGSYTVRVTNSGSAENPSSFCPAAPGLVILYEDSSMPEYEYWILEGADVLEGGRRGGAGNLAWWECTNNATFNGSIDASNVSSATLGMVSIWGGEAWGAYTSYYWFNDCYLGEGGNTLFGYSSLYNETIDSMSMFVGASGNAQVGANVSDVTACVKSEDNFVSFIDDGDSMMPANAFLLVEYGEEVPPKPDLTVTEKNETLLEDGNFSVNYTVANIGDGNAGASNTTIYIDGVNVLEDTVPALAAGENYTNTVGPFDCPCNQTLSITVCADNNDIVDESDEGNNCLSNEWVCPVCIESIEAGVRIEPETLNLNSSGVFTAFITLPEKYDVKNINVSTVRCEEAPLVDHNIVQGINTLNAKFNVQDLREDLPTGDNVTMTVRGALTDGTAFKGSDIICVIAH